MVRACPSKYNTIYRRLKPSANSLSTSLAAQGADASKGMKTLDNLIDDFEGGITQNMKKLMIVSNAYGSSSGILQYIDLSRQTVYFKLYHTRD